jgi:hypothetical protein
MENCKVGECASPIFLKRGENYSKPSRLYGRGKTHLLRSAFSDSYEVAEIDEQAEIW